MTNPGSLARLLYTSRTARRLGDAELIELVQQARTRNARDGIRGVLLTNGPRSVRWIEGPRSTVQRLGGDLQCHPRHAGVEPFYRAQGKGRLSHGCAMRLLFDGNQLRGFGLGEFHKDSIQSVRHDRGRLLPAVESTALQQALPAVAELAMPLARREESSASRFHDRLFALQPSSTALGSDLVEPVLAEVRQRMRARRFHNAVTPHSTRFH